MPAASSPPDRLAAKRSFGAGGLLLALLVAALTGVGIGVLVGHWRKNSAQAVVLADRPLAPPASTRQLARRAQAAPAVPSARALADAEPRVLDLRSADSGARYDRPVRPHRAVGVDPSAALVVQFAEQVCPERRSMVLVRLRLGSRDVPVALDWRANPTLLVRPRARLLPGTAYTLVVRAAPEARAARLTFLTHDPGRLDAVPADVDGDGDLDLVAGGPRSELTVYDNTPDGGLPAARGRALGVFPSRVAVADFTGDALLDVAAVLAPEGAKQALCVVLFVARRAGGRSGGRIEYRRCELSVPAALSATPASAVQALIARDLDRDGGAELLLVDAFGNVARWERRGGQLRASVVTRLDTRGLVTAVALGALAVPGPLALVVADTDPARGVVAEYGLFGGASSSAPAPSAPSAPVAPARRTLVDPAGRAVVDAVSLALADLDRDGYPDVYAARMTRDDIAWLGGADGLRPASLAGIVTDALTRAVCVADFNADRHPDLAVAGFARAGVTLYLNDRRGGFNAGVAVAAPVGLFGGDPRIDADGDGLAESYLDAPSALVPGDFDGDGVADLFAASARRPYLVLTGGLFRARPTFASSVEFRERDDLLPEPRRPLATAVAGDVNNDGALDLVVGYRDGGVEVWLRDRFDRYRRAQVLQGPGAPHGAHLALVDLDRDGRLDLVDTLVGERRDRAAPLARVYENLGPPFAGAVFARRADARLVVPSPGDTAELQTACFSDFTGDGRVDAFFAGVGTAWLYTQTEDGRFALRAGPTELLPPAPGAYNQVVALDVDGDGDLDLALSGLARGAAEGAALVLSNDGQGQFSARPLPAGGTATAGLLAADVDADGAPDLLWIDVDANRLVVALNRERRGGTVAAGELGGGWETRRLPLRRYFVALDGLTVLDPDRDGDDDPVVFGRRRGADGKLRWQQVWINDSTGAFRLGDEASSSLRATAAGEALVPQVAADLTGDGWSDLFALDAAGNPHLITASPRR